MINRVAFLWPEIALFVTTCVVMVLGLSRTYAARKATALFAGVGIIAAILLAISSTPRPDEYSALAGQTLLPAMPLFAKCLIGVVGLLLLLLMAGTVDRDEEARIAAGERVYDPLRSNRAEFYAFFLFSLTGLMLCASADNLIWLFLALELTSLPTYIMVAMSSPRGRAKEAGVKYFFLGALGAATFLYGFALIYGAAGTTNLNLIASHIATEGFSPLMMAGVLLSLLGFAFKIAAVPMHFYTPDVYEGAAPQVSAFLAFVPKTAGFIAIVLLCATVGWQFAPSASPDVFETVRQTAGGTQLPEAVRTMLWVMAALTMTAGNVLAILQTSVKRMLAYSSVAHSGYMLVGVVAGPGGSTQAFFTSNGISAVFFYLLCYGVMNAGCFAVLAALERSPGRDGTPREIETVADLRGLCRAHPALGWSMVLCSLSLLGLPPLLGFFGKLPLFTSGIRAGEIPLVIILGINSAIAAYYYLRLAFTPMLEEADPSAEPLRVAPFPTRRIGAIVSAGGVVLLAIGANSLMVESHSAAEYRAPAKNMPRALTAPASPLPGAAAALKRQAED
jgi:NADH-quinone oxidoreductase subunit N